jgi:hypothetical protein
VIATDVVEVTEAVEVEVIGEIEVVELEVIEAAVVAEISAFSFPSLPHPRSLQGKDWKLSPAGLGRKTCNFLKSEEEG